VDRFINIGSAANSMQEEARQTYFVGNGDGITTKMDLHRFSLFAI